VTSNSQALSMHAYLMLMRSLTHSSSWAYHDVGSSASGLNSLVVGCKFSH